MRRIKCKVSYVGRAYDGWQSQRNGSSIQEKIEEVLFRICQERINICGSGRTDALVNAKEQVFHFDTNVEMTPYKWKGALNGYLPKDIHIDEVEEVDECFHARHCVRFKQYDYRIHFGEYDVFKKDYSYYSPYSLDVESMKDAATLFVGEHDFTSFNSSSLKEYPNLIRNIKSISFLEEGNDLTISFVGKGFLRYMVRMLVAALMEVGKGKLEKKDIEEILKKKSKRAFSKNAEAQGLTLQHVDYFEILALNEEGMIREYLYGDRLVEGYSLEELETAVKKKEDECYYVFMTRNTQQQLGYLYCSKNEVCLKVFKEDNLSLAERLIQQANSKLKQYGYPEGKIRLE
ncbi:MAG: tRNA pseudouridine(38-40) synthase TruA [Solobacterium sp.]|nr:tRNA pseudouridine(38-40) synthase TruA [Solobacterium sp.]